MAALEVKYDCFLCGSQKEPTKAAHDIKVAQEITAWNTLLKAVSLLDVPMSYKWYTQIFYILFLSKHK